MEAQSFLVISFLIFNISLGHLNAKNIYDFLTKEILSNNDFSMEAFQEKVLLIVNVASECGFTDGHYKELVQLQNMFSDKQFHVIAFPCNQFGSQEPGSNKKIFNFANSNYNINFRMFAKLETIGENAHPLYKWLKSQSGGYEPNWNFCKYLIDKNGNVVRYASPYVDPLEMQNDIMKLINGEKLQGSIIAYEDGSLSHDEF